MAGATSPEEILAPELPIIDPHHHLWLWTQAGLDLFPAGHPAGLVSKRQPRYLLDELLTDLNSGHNIVATVYVENGCMYRPDGPAELRCIGEVEFANGVAAMAASGLFGHTKVCAGIIGAADLRQGDKVEPVLRALIQAGNGRLRGIRSPTSYVDEDFYAGTYSNPPHIMADAHFRAGFKWLHKLDLIADLWVFDHQLAELTDLARAFPSTQIVLNHGGTPLGAGRYAGKREERFSPWRQDLRALAACPNVSVKIGGLGMHVSGFASFNCKPPAGSAQLAAEWKPYVETCIEAFGAKRCMFESNFPVDKGTSSYATLWNAFKRLTMTASADEKAALFSGTARRIYKLDV
jgi:predicted TIM-barrel fold metal-dependent hydrolase